MRKFCVFVVGDTHDVPIMWGDLFGTVRITLTLLLATYPADLHFIVQASIHIAVIDLSTKFRSHDIWFK